MPYPTHPEFSGPIRPWTNEDLTALGRRKRAGLTEDTVLSSDVSMQPHGPLPPVGGDQDQLLAATKRTLAKSDPLSRLAFPKAAALRQAHPGAYDGIPDQKLEDALRQRDAENEARFKGHGYLPGLNTSVPRAMGEGFLSGTAEAATPGKLGLLAALGMALPTGGVSLGAVPAALAVGGASEAASLARTHYDTPGAPKTFGDFAGETGEAAAQPLIAGAMGEIPGAIRKLIPATAGANPKWTSGVGATLGGVNGYRRGGISGGIEGALVGGTLGASVPKSLQALQVLTKARTEVTAAEDAAAAYTGRGGNKANWAAKAAEDFPYQRDAAPSMSNAPDQNPGELYPYQKDQIAESLAALKNVAGRTSSGEPLAIGETTNPGAQAALDRWKSQPSSGVADKMSLEGQFGPEQKAWAENKYGGPGVVDLSEASAPRSGDISQEDALHFNDELQAINQLSPLDRLARASARSKALRSGQPIDPNF